VENRRSAKEVVWESVPRERLEPSTLGFFTLSVRNSGNNSTGRTTEPWRDAVRHVIRALVGRDPKNDRLKNQLLKRFLSLVWPTQYKAHEFIRWAIDNNVKDIVLVDEHDPRLDDVADS
jgi:hypothetical protein